MRLSFIIGLLTLTYWASAQSYSDIITQHSAMDSLKKTIITSTARIDSTKNKDSLTITNFSKANRIIKQEIHRFRGDECTYNKSTTIYNSQELPSFIEHFEQPCLTAEERKREEITFEKLQYWYERFEYDTLGRVVIKVRWYPTVKARRFEYSYDKDGNQIQHSRRIEEETFWN